MQAAPRAMWVQAQAIWPGLALCSVVGLAAGFLSEHYGGPQLLYALLLGMALNFLSSHESLTPGIVFTSKTLLRVGVALLGARITVDQIAQLGWQTGMVVALGVVSTIACGLLLARLLRRPNDEGWISGVSVAICGASAALAISAALPQTHENERHTLLTVMGVTLLSTIAMVLYPLVLSLLDVTGVPAGIFLGATIHDVAQVVAAGTMLGPEARDSATIVKLFRVAMLAPVVVVISIIASRGARAAGSGRPPIVPGFLVGFIALVALGSLGLTTSTLTQAATDGSRALLVAAIAGAAMRTRLQDLALVGWRPVAMLVGETVFLALLVLATLLWL
ncbi:MULTISPECIES: YeiH family protein [Acidovorax]|uniref:YeiH family protein n=1 Tax=Acidovorax TaxID=12916 RepID=UPI0003F5FAF7|nr:putative sulfate exporter family transporter [Acidovorax sp. JHL-9]